MKKFVFISILFFIFVFQTKAQSYRSSSYSGGIFTTNYATQSRPHFLQVDHLKGNKSYSINKIVDSFGPIYYSSEMDEYKKAAQCYIEVMYKAHSADNQKQKEVISTAEARRIEFSDNK